MTESELRAIEERAEKATPGEWAWRYCVGGLPALFHPGHGMLLIMDAVRVGTSMAVLRFARRDERDKGGIMFKATEFFQEPGCDVPDFQEPSNPDMQFIAHAREDVPALCAEVRRLRDEAATVWKPTEEEMRKLIDEFASRFDDKYLADAVLDDFARRTGLIGKGEHGRTD